MNGFSDFWDYYPRKRNKRDAEKAWNAAVKRFSPEAILAALEQAKDEWRGRRSCYIPYPASWIRATDFDEEFEARADDKEPDLFTRKEHLCQWCDVWHWHQCKDCESGYCSGSKVMACIEVLKKMRGAQ